MGVITYTAKRKIIGGHTAGIEYQLETALTVIDDYARERGTEAEMLNGAIEYELDNIVDHYRLETDLIAAADLPGWKEFMHSVMAREVFAVDLTGTIASPGTDLPCILARGGYSPVRDGLMMFRLQFDVRLV